MRSSRGRFTSDMARPIGSNNMNSQIVIRLCFYLLLLFDFLFRQSLPWDSSKRTTHNPKFILFTISEEKAATFWIRLSLEDAHWSGLGPYAHHWGKHSAYRDSYTSGPRFLDYLWGGRQIGGEALPHPHHKHRCEQVQSHWSWLICLDPSPTYHSYQLQGLCSHWVYTAVSLNPGNWELQVIELFSS